MTLLVVLIQVEQGYGHDGRLRLNQIQVKVKEDTRWDG